MDFGFPQTTDSKILQEWESSTCTHTHFLNISLKASLVLHDSKSSPLCCRYITQEGAKLEVAKSKVPTTVTNAVSWRSEGIKYKKNEVFIDVIESINVLVRWKEGFLIPLDLHTNYWFGYVTTTLLIQFWSLVQFSYIVSPITKLVLGLTAYLHFCKGNTLITHWIWMNAIFKLKKSLLTYTFQGWIQSHPKN